VVESFKVCQPDRLEFIQTEEDFLKRCRVHALRLEALALIELQVSNGTSTIL
jgi:hypothetical protein